MRISSPKPLLALLSAGALVVLGGCGSNGDVSTANPTDASGSSVSVAPSEALSDPAPAPTNDLSAADTTSHTDESASATTEPTEPTEHPVSTERIVALDETAALNLLTLGIEPTVVLTSLSSDLFLPIADELGLTIEPFLIAEPSMEFLAGLAPDRIVALGNPFVVGRLGEYQAIAPVTVVPVDGTWQEQVSALAADFDLADRADGLIADVEAAIDELADALASDDDAGASISVMTVRGDMTIAATGNSPAGSVLTTLGFTRPAPQAQSGTGLPFTPLTLETLGEHDADVVVLPSGSLFSTDVITSSPLFPTLGAVARDRVYEVAAEPWIVGGSAFAAWWIADDLGQMFLDHELPAAAADAAERWQEFTALRS